MFVTLEHLLYVSANKLYKRRGNLLNHIKDNWDRTYIDIPEVHDSLTQFDVTYAREEDPHQILFFSLFRTLVKSA